MAASASCRFFIWTAITVLVQSAINIEEINSVSYHLDILNKPVLSSQVSSGLVMHLTSKYGQEYQCNLPEIPSRQDDAKFNDDPSSPTYLLSDISILLKPLETGPCLVKTKDWWTYEFCYGKHIKQYHLEDNKIVSPVIVLGIYESEYDWKNKSKDDETSRNRLQRYHSQYYVNGTKCEVTSTSRRSEVRFLCEEGAGDYISQVNEPESCRYIISVHTTRVCHHPYLRPPPTNKPHPIVCNPVLTTSQYEIFQKQEEEDKKMVEVKRKAWLAKQEERLVALKQLKSDEMKKNTYAQTDENQNEKIISNSITGSQDTLFATSIRNTKTETTDNVKLEYLESVANSEETVNVDSNGLPELHELSLSKLAEQLQLLGKELENKIEEQVDMDKEEESKDTVDIKQETFKKMSDTLSQLLKQLDKAEQDLNNANEALWNLQNSITRQDNKREQDSSLDKSEEVVTQKTHLQMEPATEVADKDEDTSKTRNPLRLKMNKFTPELLNILKLKHNKKQGDFKEGEKDSEDVNVVEQALLNHLRQSGLDTLGTKVEVKIITAGYFNEDNDEFQMMNEEESDQLQTILIKLLAGNDEATKHLQRQNELEKNYRFMWDSNKHETDDNVVEEN